MLKQVQHDDQFEWMAGALIRRSSQRLVALQQERLR